MRAFGFPAFFCILEPHRKVPLEHLSVTALPGIEA